MIQETNMRIILFSLFILSLNLTLNAQRNAGGPRDENAASKGTISGTIVDELSGRPMEYANVILYSLRDSSLVSGTVTNETGRYTLNHINFGPYFLKVKFLGYNEFVLPRLVVNPQNVNVEVPVIKLQPDSKNLNEVEVAADRTEVLFKLDKKVVTVGSNLNIAGGTAVDALENTPSVQVDIEGNVSLRGSSNFTVLIDGKPSPFSGSDALEMIPASTIDKIEIITNPSAKYDPEGTAGIINVITKHNSLEGLSALVNVNADTQGGYGGDILVNYNVNKMNFYVGLNYNDNVRKGVHLRETRVNLNDTNYYTYADGSRDGGGIGTGLRLGMDFPINSKSDFTAVFSLGDRKHKSDNRSDYYETVQFSEDTLWSSSEANSGRNNFNTKLDLDYKYRFNNEGRELKSTLSFSSGKGDELNETIQLERLINTELSSVSTTENGDDVDYQFNLDYTHPFNKTTKIETGLQSKIEWQEERYDLKYNDNLASVYFSDSLTSRYYRSIQAAYMTFSQEIGKFGYQLGLRGEHTDRMLENLADGETYPIKRFDIFPTVHTSLQLPADQQIQASFARRIQRPGNYALEPFETYRDIYTIWKGNPGLKPEYTNAYEISYQKKLGMSFISAEVFHRSNFNKMERTFEVYDENTMLMTMQNVGTDYSTGGELMFNLNLMKWWNFNLTGSAFHYKIDTDLFQSEKESFNWDFRTRNTFRIGKSLRFQIDGNYNSPSVSAQGTREGFWTIGTSARMSFFDNRLSATLQIRDIFFTAKHEFIMETPSYYSRALFARNGQVVQLSLSYKINNFKEKKKVGRGGDFEGGGDMDF